MGILLRLIFGLIGLIPFRVLYFLSDMCLYPLLYHVIGYRRKVVRSNIQKALAHMSPVEHLATEKAFYKYLCDLIIEQLKAPSMTADDISKYIVITNPEEIKDYDLNRNVIVTLAHLGNWEYMAVALSNVLKNPCYALYAPIKNKSVERFMIRNRSKAGLRLIRSQEGYGYFAQTDVKNWNLGLIADQAASGTKGFWMEFLGLDSPFFTGPAKFSIKYNAAVYYWKVSLIKRGQYSITWERLFDDGSKHSIAEITEKYAKAVERDILENPALWLWSHKRWKRAFPNEPNPELISKRYPVKAYSEAANA